MIIIPDVHGRTFWRKAVKEYMGDEPILFLGDYLDPYAYEEISPADAFEVFHEIMDIKKSNPEAVTLLLGNHDLHLPVMQVFSRLRHRQPLVARSTFSLMQVLKADGFRSIKKSLGIQPRQTL